MLLEGKVALITGAASGIGWAAAQLFAREGAKTIAVDINESGCQETVQHIREASGDTLFLQADVGKMDDIRAAVEAGLNHYGRLDIIHSNAAAYTMGTATEISERDWDRTLDVCLKATWMLGPLRPSPDVEPGRRCFRDHRF